MKDYLYGVLFLILCIGILINGLFFDQTFFIIETVLYLMFLIYSIYILCKKREIPIFPSLLFIFPMICLLFLFTSNENLLGTYQELLRFSAYACFFFMLYSISKEKKIYQAMETSVIWLGLSISMVSLLAYCEWVPFDTWIVNNRIGGPFEYPNSYGAVMGAFFIYTLYLFVNKTPNIKAPLLAISMFSFSVHLFLSGSIGAIGVTVVVFIVSLFIISTDKQWLTLFYFVTNWAAAMLIYIIRDYTIAMAVFYILGAYGMILIVKKVPTLTLKKEKSIPLWLIPSALLICAIGTVIGLQLFKEPTAIERLQMSKDALQIIVQHPFGIGGNAWEMIYSTYQSYPYIASELHNGYLNFVVDWGIIGVVVGIALITIVIKLCVTYKIKFSVPPLLFCVVLLLHATIDFTLSFGSIWFLLFWQLCLAIKPGYKITTMKKVPVLIPIMLLICFTIVMSSKFAYAELLNKQWSSDLSVTEAATLLERGMDANRYDPELQRRAGALYARLYAMTNDEELKEKAFVYLKKSESLQPHNSELKLQLIESYKLLQENEELLDLLVRGIDTDPFQKVFYEEAFAVINQLEETEKVLSIKQQITRQYGQAKERWQNTNLPERYNAKDFN